MATKKKGRPRLAEDAVRNEKIMVRLTTDEREAFDEQAKAMGVTVSTWLRVVGREKLKQGDRR